MIGSLEICAYSSYSVSIAAIAGAQRIELCAGRGEGGTTPGYGLLSAALNYPNIGIFPIIRPRGGDFCYTASEFNEMLKDVEMCRNMGVQGIVTGILNSDGTFDSARMLQLKDVAGPLEFCVHRAIDMSRNPLEAIDSLIDLGVKRVLSSGARNTAIEGIDLLEKMIAHSNNRIEIMAGSGVNASQIETLWNIGIRHFHASASGQSHSPMVYQNPYINMGKDGKQDEYLRTEADQQKIEAIINNLRSLSSSSFGIGNSR
jgi:copper homeostasis protein